MMIHMSKAGDHSGRLDVETVNRTPWVVYLICCDRDDGQARFETWEQADAFRESYVGGVGNHVRTAVVRQEP